MLFVFANEAGAPPARAHPLRSYCTLLNCTQSPLATPPRSKRAPAKEAADRPPKWAEGGGGVWLLFRFPQPNTACGHNQSSMGPWPVLPAPRAGGPCYRFARRVRRSCNWPPTDCPPRSVGLTRCLRSDGSSCRTAARRCGCRPRRFSRRSRLRGCGCSPGSGRGSRRGGRRGSIRRLLRE